MHTVYKVINIVWWYIAKTLLIDKKNNEYIMFMWLTI